MLLSILAGQAIQPDFMWEHLLLVVGLLFVGVMLLGIEVFIFPGFGVGGILGLVFLLGGTVTAWILLGPIWGALVVVVVSAASMALLIAGMKSKFVRKRFVLDSPQEHGGSTSAQDYTDLVGREGIAHSDLRPAGIAIIDDRRVDVVSDGTMIEKGNAIHVLSVDGPRVVVALCDNKVSESQN